MKIRICVAVWLKVNYSIRILPTYIRNMEKKAIKNRFVTGRMERVMIEIISPRTMSMKAEDIIDKLTTSIHSVIVNYSGKGMS